MGSYRPTMSAWDTLKSLFNLHNETGNVWTHLIGFLIFVGFTVYFAVSPPAPLTFSSEQVHALWGSVQGNFHPLQNIHLNLQQLQGSLQTGVYKLQDNLQQGVHALQDNLQLGVHALQDGVQLGVHALQDGVHTLGDNLHLKAQVLRDNLHSLTDNVQDNLQHATDSLNAKLTSVITPLLQWPTVRWPVYVYMAGAMICLLTSSVCHLFGCCKKDVHHMLWRFDYSGIAVLIVTSFFPPVYYGFMCSPFWRNFYLLVTSTLGAAVVCVSLSEYFQQARFRPLRASLFSGLGLFGLVPVMHQWVLHSHVWHVRAAITHILLMGAVYLMGAVVFVARVPERWLPGRFDLLLHSHQIFHVAVVVAAVIHARSAYLLLQWRDAGGGCAVPPYSADTPEHVLGFDAVMDGVRVLLHDYLGRSTMVA